MRQRIIVATLIALAFTWSLVIRARNQNHFHGRNALIQLGAEPLLLVDRMSDSGLKDQLRRCVERPFEKTDFSIGHRAACLDFPEHTRESYEAAARMGAGILECHVAFTKDLELVCRESQNDLHRTTNILVTPLADTCIVPFTPAVIKSDGTIESAATAECRTSELTLAEFKTLTGKSDRFNPRAQSPEEFIASPPMLGGDLDAEPSTGHLVSHKESIELFKRMGVKMMPHLAAPSVAMPFNGFTQDDYAQKLIDEYKHAGVPPSRVFPQSFAMSDVLYWVQHEPAYGKHAIYLHRGDDLDQLPGFFKLLTYKRMGINIVGVPVFALLDAVGNQISGSQYAYEVRDADLDIITWMPPQAASLPGDRNLPSQGSGFTLHERDVMNVLDVLAKDVSILGISSDQPAAATYYANCVGRR